MAGAAQPQQVQTTANRAGLWPLLDFAVHVAVGTLIFAVIAGGAVALDFINHRLKGLGVDPLVGYGLIAAEYAVFATDLLLFLVFLAKTGARAARSF